jgi:hypothetical protein
MTAELHCHSLFSVDGYRTPEEVAEAAARAGVSSLALTDHNCLDGLARCRSRAEALGLAFLDGAELDVKWAGGDYHAVAFGFDPAHPGLGALCRRNFAEYETNFARLMPVLAAKLGLVETELRAALPRRYRTHPAPVLSKWFARGYVSGKGLFPDHETAMRAMTGFITEAEKDVPSERIWPFASLEESRDAVHAAGGVLLLAHVGGCAPTLDGQLKLVRGALDAGLDGFELYHPANTRCAHFPELVAEARRLGCAVSGGSDSHGAPERGPENPAVRAPVPDWVVATIDAALARRRG